jgi:hypothetical protein
LESIGKHEKLPNPEQKKTFQKRKHLHMEEKIAIARKIRKQQRWGFKKRGKAHETASD